MSKFQFTRPQEARRTPPGVSFEQMLFQFTRPQEARPRLPVIAQTCEGFNSRARKRRDKPNNELVAKWAKFQFTRPQEARHPMYT